MTERQAKELGLQRARVIWNRYWVDAYWGDQADHRARQAHINKILLDQWSRYSWWKKLRYRLKGIGPTTWCPERVKDVELGL